MTLLISLLTTPTTQALAWTLVHFLWQGALLAIVAAAVMRWVTPSARARHAFGVLTLAAMLAAPVATFVVLRPAPFADAPMTAGQVAAVNTVASDRPGDGVTDNGASPMDRRATPTVLPIVVAMWLSGVVILSVRLLGGWLVARRLANGAGRPVEAHVQALATRVASRLNLHRFVRLAESSAVAVPVVVGWLKPVVLLPAAALSGLAPAHLEALLAHELAHVRRQDYLVNLLQSVVETLLFYHPGVWWLSGRVRIEREHCCDDLAVTVCDRFIYVDALTDLAAMTMHPKLALAATDGPLLRRVRRLLESGRDERPAAGWLSIGVVVLLAAGLTPAVLALRGDDGQASATPRAIATPATTALAAEMSIDPRSAVPPSAAASAMPATPGVPAIESVVAALAVEQQPGEAAEQQKRMEVERSLTALKQQLMTVEAELVGLTRQRRQIDDENARQEIQARRETTAANLEMLRAQLQSVASRRDVGLVPDEAVAAVKAEIGAAERALRGIEMESRSREAAGELDAHKAELERVHAAIQQEFAAQSARAQTLTLGDARLAARELVARLEAAAKAVRDAAAGQAVSSSNVSNASQLDEELRRRQELSAEAVRMLESERRRLAATGFTSQLPPSPTLVKVGGSIQAPKKLTHVDPVYPLFMRTAKIEGNVYLDVIIGIDGRVRDAKATGGTLMLTEAALEAVRQWVYEPTVFDKQPVEVQMALTIVFRLDSSSPTAVNAPQGGFSNNFPRITPTGAPAVESAAQGTADATVVATRADSVPVADPSTQVRPGDVLHIDIAGEDQLPRAYGVNGSGAIRLPLIGLLPVRGMTAGQVREAVVKALADRKLAGGRTVTVELRRRN